MKSASASGDATRRDVLKGGLAAAAAAIGAPLAAPAAAADAPRAASAAGAARVREERADVLVIGAGLAGLNAARLLAESGATVIVLEARDRVGGRVFSLRDLPGAPEAGGNSILAGYARALDLCRTLGVKTYDAAPRQKYDSTVLALRDRLIPQAEWAKSPLNPFGEGDRAIPPTAYAMTLVGRHNPLKALGDWLDPANAKYDVSMYEAMRSWGASEDAIALGHDTNVAYGTSAHDVSTLMMYFTERWFARQREFGSAATVVVGGNSGLPEAMARPLRESLRLGAEVAGIAHGGGEVVATCTDGRRFRAGRAVLALPLPPMRRIRFDPLLSPLRREAIELVPQMKITEVHLVPTRRFWESDGLGTSMWTDGPAGVVSAQRGGSDPQEVTSFLLWGRGHVAEYLDSLGAEAAGRRVIAEIERLRPAARGSLKVGGFKSWQLDPYSGGDWVVWRPGQVQRYARALGAQEGRLHFAGEHTGTLERGMESALESGERTALEILGNDSDVRQGT